MNLSNVNNEIRAQIDAIKEHAEELSANAATWWNNTLASIPGRVETTKQTIKNYDYEGIIGSLAKADGVDPLLIMSFIVMESNGNPNAYNGYYCGCMQVDPDVYFSSTDRKNFDHENGDPKLNAQIGIEAGIRAIFDKYNAYSTNPYLMIASYNAGQGIAYSALKHLNISEEKAEWWSTIEYLAHEAAETYYAEKFNEVGEYSIGVMYAYALLSGYNVEIGELPQAHDPSKKTDLSGFLLGGLAAPATSKPIIGPPKPHGKHKDTPVSAPSKTYCEPVYPDYVCVSDEIPQALNPELEKIPVSELVVNDNLIFTYPIASLVKAGCEAYVNEIAMNNVIADQRKKAFNPEQHKRAFKVPSSGKPANNNDPFPVDAKIEEFEQHSPRCKINSIVTCEPTANTAKALISLSMNVEKRLVKLENNIATILRYLHRLGARVPINCVYYGGQCTHEKYKCIRCMKDDRLSDGQMMSIDQCLCCTRYEPIIGQVYDILNDEGLNLSQILDDAQMSYSTMEEYCNFVSPVNSQKEIKTDTLHADAVNIRLVNEKDFKDEWPQGVKMKWDLFPVEDQKPHINRRQSINEENFDTLNSSMFTGANHGRPFTGVLKTNKIIENRKDIDKYLEGKKKLKDDRKTALREDLKRIILEAKDDVTPKFAQYVDDMTSYLGDNIVKLLKDKGENIDNLLIASLVFATGMSANDILDRYLETKKTLEAGNVTNEVLSAVFVSFNTELLFGKDEKEPNTFPMRLDRVKQIVESKNSSDDTTETRMGFGLDWKKINDWNWLDFVEPLDINFYKNEKVKIFDESFKIFVKVAYIYAELQSKCSTSRYDNSELGLAFPFFEEDLRQVAYTSPFTVNRVHPITGNVCAHHGVDLGAPAGTPIHSIADGTVEYVIPDGEQANGGGNMICIRHTADLTSRYMHMLQIEVTAGQKLKKGDIVGHVGSTGFSSGPHLHFEVQLGGTDSSFSKDPTDFYPLLKTVPLGSCLADY